MAISYPLATPTSIGIESITLRTRNSVALSQSMFSFKQQVIEHTGQRWEASITIPPVRRETSAEWVAMLVALKGFTGTFLLSDPDYVAPRGTVTSCDITGVAGDETVSINMVGTLLAGDYLQLGSGSSAKLHKVLIDQSGNGTLEIWPALRAAYTNETGIFEEPSGVFRLNTNVSEWSINNANSYGISFEAVEAIT
jgi:hypothetical protein